MTGVDIVNHPEVVNQVELLVDGPDLALDPAQLTGIQTRQVLTQDAHFAGSRKQGAVQQADKGALPGTAGANQGHPLTWFNAEIDILESGEGAKLATGAM